MASLWRALALVWLGGVASPALMDDAEPVNVVISVPANLAGGILSAGDAMLNLDGKPDGGTASPSTAHDE
jgi:hypothetical protein